MRGERLVRFVCGALVGLASGCGLASQLHSGKAVTILLTLGVAGAFGAAAVLLGDQFWLGPRPPRNLDL
jgi:hypothetical protein